MGGYAAGVQMSTVSAPAPRVPLRTRIATLARLAASVRLKPTAIALLLVAIGMLYVFPYSKRLNNPNERTRVLQASAIVHNGSLAIGEAFVDDRGRLMVRDLYGTVHDGLFVNDVGLVCSSRTEEPPTCAGRIFPAKAPGVSLLGVPAVFVASKLGVLEFEQQAEPLLHWIVRYSAVVLPVLVALWCFAQLLRRAGASDRFAALAVVATGLGTGVFPYGLAAVGHVLSGGVIVIGAYLLVLARERRYGFFIAAAGGLVAAYAVMLEYHAMLAVACVGVWVLSLRSWRLLLGFGTGSAITAAAFGGLHQLMFTSPFKTGHFFLASQHNRASQAGGMLGISGFYPSALLDHLVDPYMGLAPFMPWLAVGLVVAFVSMMMPRRPVAPSELRRLWWALFAVVVLYVLFVSSLGTWRVMNGWSIGPRYLMPAMFPLAWVVSVAWHRASNQAWIDGLMRGLAAASVVVCALTTFAYPSPPDSLRNTFADGTIPMLLQGYAVSNAGQLVGLQSGSIIVFLLYVAAIVVFLLEAEHDEARGRKGRALGWFVLLAFLSVLVLVGRTPSATQHSAIQFMKRTSDGVTGFGERP